MYGCTEFTGVHSRYGCIILYVRVRVCLGCTDALDCGMTVQCMPVYASVSQSRVLGVRTGNLGIREGAPPGIQTQCTWKLEWRKLRASVFSLFQVSCRSDQNPRRGVFPNLKRIRTTQTYPYGVDGQHKEADTVGRATANS